MTHENIDDMATYTIFGRDLMKLPPAALALIQGDLRQVIQHLVWTEADIDDYLKNRDEELEEGEEPLDLTDDERALLKFNVHINDFLDDATIGRVNNDLFRVIEEEIKEIRNDRETEATNGNQ